MPKIEVYTGPGCRYCDRAKRLLDEKGLVYRELDVSEPAALDELRARLPRVRALPQIFIDGEHVGSFEDLEHLENSGRLRELGN